MAFTPQIKDVPLQACCRETLLNIHSDQKLFRLLQAVLAASPWLSILGANPPTAIASLLTTDWDALRHAVQAVGEWEKERVRQYCYFELTQNHPGKLAAFWQALHDSFR